MQNKFIKFWVIYILLMFFPLTGVFGAVGCSLNDPDRDVKRIFPESTGYKTEFFTIKENGGDTLALEIEEKLGDKLDKVFEAQDVAYAYYTILKGKEIIGYIHGVNQKGMFGGMQIILATNPAGIIVDIYYQKISSPEAKKFRDKEFLKQFKGLSLADFYQHDSKPEKEFADSKIVKIKDPSKNSNKDFIATLRGIKKNLILCDEFKLGNKFDKDFKKSKEETK